MTVIAGSASITLAKSIATDLKTEFILPQKTDFPDGEFKLTLPSIEDYAVIVQSCPYPQSKNIFELFLLLEGCKNSDQRIVVIPYLPFSRQDKEFLGGEITTSKVISKLLESSGTTHIITVDAHSQAALSHFSVPVTNISAMPLFGKYFKNEIRNPLIIAPDKKALQFAKLIENETGGESIFFEKKRDKKTGKVDFEFPDVDVRERDVIICDDIISSGGTMIPAIQFAKDNGANEVKIAVTHGLFLNGVVSKLEDLGAQIITSDSVQCSDIKSISLSNQIATEIKKLVS